MFPTGFSTKFTMIWASPKEKGAWEPLKAALMTALKAALMGTAETTSIKGIYLFGLAFIMLCLGFFFYLPNQGGRVVLGGGLLIYWGFWGILGLHLGVGFAGLLGGKRRKKRLRTGHLARWGVRKRAFGPQKNYHFERPIQKGLMVMYSKKLGKFLPKIVVGKKIVALRGSSILRNLSPLRKNHFGSARLHGRRVGLPGQTGRMPKKSQILRQRFHGGCEHPLTSPPPWTGGSQSWTIVTGHRPDPGRDQISGASRVLRSLVGRLGFFVGGIFLMTTKKRRKSVQIRRKIGINVGKLFGNAVGRGGTGESAGAHTSL